MGLPSISVSFKEYFSYIHSNVGKSISFAREAEGRLSEASLIFLIEQNKIKDHFGVVKDHFGVGRSFWNVNVGIMYYYVFVRYENFTVVRH